MCERANGQCICSEEMETLLNALFYNKDKSKGLKLYARAENHW